VRGHQAIPLFVLALFGVRAPSAEGQTVLVQRNVNLRRDPSTNQPPIRLLRPPEELDLLDTAKTNNYYRVHRDESDESGWVWANNVRLMADSGDASTLAGGQLATAIDSTWPKPVPVVGSFESPVTGVACGPGGDGGDTLTNRLKNRTDAPASYRAVTFAAIGNLAYPATRSCNGSRAFRFRWSAT
jgi:hypothetical protein